MSLGKPKNLFNKKVPCLSNVCQISLGIFQKYYLMQPKGLLRLFNPHPNIYTFTPTALDDIQLAHHHSHPHFNYSGWDHRHRHHHHYQYHFGPILNHTTAAVLKTFRGCWKTLPDVCEFVLKTCERIVVATVRDFIIHGFPFSYFTITNLPYKQKPFQCVGVCTQCVKPLSWQPLGIQRTCQPTCLHTRDQSQKNRHQILEF